MRIFIRHGSTEGNLSGKYTGCRTDEPLCPEGRKALESLHLPEPDIVYVSPMLRCRETAEILFPHAPVTVVEDFRECDFGRFEGLSYAELNGDAEYQRWIDSGGTLPFPGGESREKFIRRCVRAYRALPLDPRAVTAFVVHGGTVMAILSELEGGNYFDYRIGNGEFLIRED